MFQMFEYANEFEILYRIVKKHEKEGKTCGDYITQMTEVMTKMEREDGTLAHYYFESIRKKVDEEIESENT